MIQVEEVYQEQEAVSSSDEYLYGEEEDISAVELGEEGDDYGTEACAGFTGAGSICITRCRNQQWYRVGCYYGCQPFVDYGQCGSMGESLCAMIGQAPHVQHCWN